MCVWDLLWIAWSRRPDYEICPDGCTAVHGGRKGWNPGAGRDSQAGISGFLWKVGGFYQKTAVWEES